MNVAPKSSSNKAETWQSEREQLIAERNQLMQLLTETEEAAAIALERQIATAVDRVRNELTAENEKLRKELQQAVKASQEWATERARLVAESERATQMLSGSDEAAAIALERQISTAVERTRAEMNAKLAALKEEHQRALTEIEGNRAGKFHKEMTAVVASVRADLEADADKLRKEIGRLKGERDEAQMQLADLQNEHSHCRAAGESANAELQNELSRLREELSHAEKLVNEYEQLAVEREQTNKLLADALEKQRATLTEYEKTASESGEREMAAAVQRVREELKAEEDELYKVWESEVAKLKDECSMATAERNRLQQELERTANAATKSEQERRKLEQDLDAALRAAQHRQPADNGQSVNIDLVREETARVEASLQAIIKAIEDPGAELAFVVRKNVEKAQLDSYLQGLRFASGSK